MIQKMCRFMFSETRRKVEKPIKLMLWLDKQVRKWCGEIAKENDRQHMRREEATMRKRDKNWFSNG